jgi:hypothetical protein
VGNGVRRGAQQNQQKQQRKNTLWHIFLLYLPLFFNDNTLAKNCKDFTRN